MKINNASTLPQVYYGLHMVEGVAEYREPGHDTYRIFIGESAIKNMDPSFAGKPVYVHHVDSVNLADLQEEADGYVTDSFFNKADGKHWCKFIAVSDAAKEAIAKGWKLSNAYIPKTFKNGGQWHGVDFEKEVTGGEYEHLAIVPNPRYEESVILTPEQFKTYNQNKESELLRLANSKESKGLSIMFFKKTKLDNAKELEATSVMLPKSKIEKTITQLVNEADEREVKKDDDMAGDEQHVMVGDEKMKVKDLAQKHMDLKNEMEEMKKKADGALDDAEADVEDEDEDGEDETDEADVTKNDEEPMVDGKKAKAPAPMKNASVKAKAKGAKEFDALRNAHHAAPAERMVLDLGQDQVARGKARYGSN